MDVDLGAGRGGKVAGRQAGTVFLVPEDPKDGICDAD